MFGFIALVASMGVIGITSKFMFAGIDNILNC